ncbi:glycoside hydrolase family 125 protein, partial [Paenibacillus xylanexedens]|uniref:glycoside hydrolase family 125 protein n=1 Tax=Paenibacillus xylanexedens TaxID=528191 RepID=UPI0034D96127
MRGNCGADDRVGNEGLGMGVNYRGMMWSGFGGSDDGCDFDYNIGGKMFGGVRLGEMGEMGKWVLRDEELVSGMGG